MMRGKLHYTRHHQSNICTQILFDCKVEDRGVICNTIDKRAIMYDKEYESEIRSHSSLIESISKEQID